MIDRFDVHCGAFRQPFAGLLRCGRLAATDAERISCREVPDDGSWLSVGPVNVGYGGTGGTLAFNALDRAGIDETFAHEIVSLRWSDTRVDSGEVAGARIWPRVPLAPPASLGSFYVLAVGRDSLTSGDECIDQSGFYPSHPAGSPFTWAIDYLDGIAFAHTGQLPRWLHGRRRPGVPRHPDGARARIRRP